MSERRPVFGPNWNWWAFRSDAGHLHLVYFDVDLAAEDEHQGHAYAVRVFLRARAANGDGIPEPREEYTDLRERLVAALEAARVPCLLAGEVWHEGYMEMLFQVDDDDDDDDAFTEVLFNWMDALTDYKVVLEPAGEDWDFFDSRISPALLGLEQIENRPLLDMLRSGITDATSEHLVEFDLTGPEPEIAAMEVELCARDFVKVEREEGFLVVGRRMHLDPLEIAETTSRLKTYTGARGCSLDGWSTAPTPDR